MYQQKIFEYFKKNKTLIASFHQLKQMASLSGLKLGTIQNSCLQLYKKGLLIKHEKGLNTEVRGTKYSYNTTTNPEYFDAVGIYCPKCNTAYHYEQHFIEASKSYMQRCCNCNVVEN